MATGARIALRIAAAEVRKNFVVDNVSGTPAAPGPSAIPVPNALAALGAGRNRASQGRHHAAQFSDCWHCRPVKIQVLRTTANLAHRRVRQSPAVCVVVNDVTRRPLPFAPSPFGGTSLENVLRDAVATFMIDVVHGTENVLDLVSATVCFYEEVVIDAGSRETVHLVETAQLVPYRAMREHEIA